VRADGYLLSRRATLLALGLSSGLLAIVQGGPFELYAISVLVLAIFVWWERRVDQPIVPVDLFGARVFTASNLAGFAVGVGMFGAIMFVPLYVQGVMGASATASGIVLTPLMLSMMITSVGSGQLISRTGRYRWALIGGGAGPARERHPSRVRDRRVLMAVTPAIVIAIPELPLRRTVREVPA
jgi:hypothetical protein